MKDTIRCFWEDDDIPSCGDSTSWDDDISYGD